MSDSTDDTDEAIEAAPARDVCFVAAVREGLADVEAGRVHAHADVVREIKAKFGQGRA